MTASSIKGKIKDKRNYRLASVIYVSESLHMKRKIPDLLVNGNFACYFSGASISYTDFPCIVFVFHKSTLLIFN